MRFCKTSNLVLFIRFLAILLLLLTNVRTAMAASYTSSSVRESCTRARHFNPQNFTHPTRIDNEFMPLIPGTQLVFNGVINTSGQAVDHQVIFTVTDLIKIIDGVRTRVIYDVDVNEGEVAEAELAFFAQDKEGNVWNLGEYPEEYENGEFVGAPSTWINGQAHARGGIHMYGKPLNQLGKPNYLQGIAPDIEFLDCGQVVDKDQSVNGYDDVLVTYETSPLDPEGGTQIKYYAPGVGIVEIGALDDPEGETMVLMDVVDLNAGQMDQIRAEALALDTHAYQVSEVYQSTPPAYKHHQDDGSGGVSTGTYDDTDLAWGYSGNWATYSGSGPYNGTLHYTSTVGDSAELTFTGTQFRLFFTKDFNRGSMDVFVDGNKIATVDAYSSSLVFQQTYTSPSYPNGNHTVQLVHAGNGAYIDIDAIQIFGTPIAVPAGTYDDTDVAWGYSGNWATTSIWSEAYNSTLHYTSTVGDSAELTFTGTQFTLVFTKDFNRGSIDVYVDGSKVATVDAYSASLVFQQTYTSPSLASGNHTLRLVHAGNGDYIDIDAITILP